MTVRETAEIKSDIIKLKEKTEVTVVSHYYQQPDIADVSDAFGGCIELANAVSQSPFGRVIVCGVYFVAQTIKILCPGKEIILAHNQARCPMSGQIYPGRVRAIREEHPEICIVCDVTASAAVKAECDLCVSPDNAQKVISQAKAANILFVSDCNLGRFVASRVTDKIIDDLGCHCPSLSGADKQDVALARLKWPDAKLAVGNRLSESVAETADFVGSPSQIIEFCAGVAGDVIIADELSTCEHLRRMFPERGFHQLAPSKLVCNNMRLTGLETLERALKGEFGILVDLPPDVSAKARMPIDRMLALSGEKFLF